MNVYVVRHARAGHRLSWTDDDALRPLDKKGWRQAEGIAKLLADAKITRLLSSPSVRCVQTLEPLAKRLGDVRIETDRRLLEGAAGQEALAIADGLRLNDEIGALCCHGDVIPDLLHILRSRGTHFAHELVWPKGSTWVLEWDGEWWSRAHYLPPPGRPDRPPEPALRR